MLVKTEWPKDAFEQWWKIYRKKADGHHARKMFDRVRKSGTLLFDDLMYATKAYMATYDEPEDPKKFRAPMKNPGTFMSKGGWTEFLEARTTEDFHRIEIRRGSPQAKAWAQHRGRDFPWGPSGVWAVDSEWPPEGDQ